MVIEDGMGTGADHLVQAGTVEIDIRPEGDGKWSMKVGRMTYIDLTERRVLACLGDWIKPNTATIVRWDGEGGA